METQTKTNPLGTEKVSKLLHQFAIPSIMAMLVSSLYNIVDQFFIGRSVGELGNAATNISFPLSILCVAIALLYGIGGSSAFNLAMGKKEQEKAEHYMGNAITMLVLCGVILFAITQLFLEPLIHFFGAPAEVVPYAVVYTRIVSFGFPFLIVATGGGHLIRADGRPRITLLCNLTGAVINTILDAIFVFGFGWGMQGAAAATIVGQVLSGGMAIWYLSHGNTVHLKKKHLRLQRQYAGMVTTLGAAPCFNQIAMMVVQIVMNRSLKYYGSISIYGEAIPIACAGIITKVNQVFMSFIIGISQGLQPIVSFNYGAGKFNRVKAGYIRAISYGFTLALFAFLLFQFAPRQLISIFGNGTEEYFKFGINYFRIFLFFTFLNFLQPITSNYFTAIGKPRSGMFLSLTRQIIFLLPVLLILPMVIGIDGIMYAGPIADLVAGTVAITMMIVEFRKPEYRKPRV
jgi:Na+-driven multidrug efflux pump